VLGVPNDKITFSYSSELAELVARSTVEEVSLADHVHRLGNQPDAPNWVYDAATWEAARRLEATPWQVDGREVVLRTDTDGNLLVWDLEALWADAWKNGELQYAALRVRLSMQTMPNLRTPVLVLDPSVARLSRGLYGTRTGWLAPRRSDSPLLCLAMEQRAGKTLIERTSMIAVSVSRRLDGECLLARGEVRAVAGRPRCGHVHRAGAEPPCRRRAGGPEPHRH
jgi:hypothetical protein